MAKVNMTGAEFKAWLNSDWGHPDTYWDEVEVTINGAITSDPDIDAIADSDRVCVLEGIMLLEGSQDKTLAASTHIKRWRQLQNEVHIAVRVPKERVVEFDAFIKTIGAARA